MRPRAGSMQAFCCMTVALITILLMYLLSFIMRLSDLTDLNLSASEVRDDEEIRVAQALSILNDRRRAKGRHAFEYKLNRKEGNSPSGSVDRDPPPGLVFAILAPNRWTHEIDSYEPSYLLESTTSLLIAIEHDLAVNGPRYAFVNVTICPTADRTESFSDLSIVSGLLPREAIKPRLKSLDSSSLSCRTILDVASCIIQSVDLFTRNSFLILLEDDLVAERHLFQQIWSVLSQFNSSVPDHAFKMKTLGAILLRIPDSENATLNSSGTIQFLFLSIVVTVLILSSCFRHWYQPSRVKIHVIFALYAFFVCMLFVNFVERLRWTHRLPSLSNKQYIFLSSRAWTESSAASILFPAEIAHNLSRYLSSLNCSVLDSQDAFGLKSRLIYDFMKRNTHSVYTTSPSMFRHRGLYSIYKHDIHNPNDLE